MGMKCRYCMYYTNWACFPGGYCKEITSYKGIGLSNDYCSEMEPMNVTEDFFCALFKQRENEIL